MACRGASLAHWVTKSYALLLTRFREVLILDSDSLPLRHPGYLFDDAIFQSAGVLLWPDLHPSDHPNYKIKTRAYWDIGLKVWAVQVRLCPFVAPGSALLWLPGRYSEIPSR